MSLAVTAWLYTTLSPMSMSTCSTMQVMVVLVWDMLAEYCSNEELL